jgi:hypothetical protein
LVADDFGVIGEAVLDLRRALEHHLAHRPHRNLFFGNDFRGIEKIEVELELIGVGHQLHPELPLGILAGLDGVPHVRAG